MGSTNEGSRVLDRFLPLMSGLDRDELERVEDVTCGVFADNFAIGYANAAWFAFARENGAVRVWGPDDLLLDGISEPLRAYFAVNLAQVVENGRTWEHDYECSSAKLHREFRLRVLVIAGGAGLLLMHALRVEEPHVAGLALVADRYRMENGLIKQCAHCRRVRRSISPFSWDWVPALVAKRPDQVITHGLCELCAAYYFGPDA